MLGAAVVVVAGFGVLLMARSFLLCDAIDNLGLATLIVAVVALIVAAILYAGARKKMAAANLKPERSIRTMERTPAAATGNLTDTGATNGGTGHAQPCGNRTGKQAHAGRHEPDDGSHRRSVETQHTAQAPTN